jgi:hypothetical protein
MNDFYYRASVALNNTGVSLIDRGFFADAMETLTEAATLVKALYQQDEDICYQKVCSGLHLANRRAAMMAPRKDVSFVVVAHNEADYVLTQPTRTHAVIRIEEDIEELDLDLDLMYAIILANLSLSLVYMGHEEAKFATGCLKQAHSLLDNLFQRYHCQGNPIWLKRVAHLATIVVATLSTALQTNGQLKEAGNMAMELYYLYRLAGSLDEAGLLFNRELLAAGAA